MSQGLYGPRAKAGKSQYILPTRARISFCATDGEKEAVRTTLSSRVRARVTFEIQRARKVYDGGTSDKRRAELCLSCKIAFTSVKCVILCVGTMEEGRGKEFNVLLYAGFSVLEIDVRFVRWF